MARRRRSWQVWRECWASSSLGTSSPVKAAFIAAWVMRSLKSDSMLMSLSSAGSTIRLVSTGRTSRK